MRSRGVLPLVWIMLASSLSAQTPSAGILTGRLTDSAGAPIVDATVTATNTNSGQTKVAATGTDGSYQFTMLPPGNYRLKFEAMGFQTLEMPPTTVGTTRAVVDGKLAPVLVEPSLGDLGFSPQQAQGSPQEQARLDRRSHMLKTHQRLGLITTAPLVAALFTSAGAKEKNGGSSGTRPARGVGRNCCGNVPDYGIVRDLRPQDSRDSDERSDPRAQGTRFYSRAGNDPHAYSGSPGVRSAESWRESSWHCRPSRRCGGGHGCRLWCGDSLGNDQILNSL